MLVDVLNDLHDKFVYLEDIQGSQTLPGIEGAKKMKAMECFAKQAG